MIRALDHHENARFGAARLRATELAPYFSPILLALRPHACDELDTIAVTGQLDLVVNPACLDGWSADELGGVLLHESHHVLRGHFERFFDLTLTSSEHLLWNLACDAAINDDLMAEGIKLPLDGGVTPATLGVEPGGTEEAYFWELHPRVEWIEVALAISGFDVHGLPTTVRSALASGSVEVDLGELRQQVGQAKALHDRTNTARHGRGTTPGRERLDVAAAKPDRNGSWSKRLHTSLSTGNTTRGGDRRSYRNPARRDPDGSDLLVPGWVSTRTRVGVLIDTSGSMTDHLPDALGEFDQVVVATGGLDLVVVTCDSEASPPQRVRRAKDITLTGGGGTDMRVGLEVLHRVRPVLDALVVLTDGETPWPAAPPPLRTIVCLLGGVTHRPPARYEVVRIRRSRR